MAAQSQPLTPKRLAALAAGLVVLTALSIWRLSETPGPDIVVITGETMGTTYTVKVVLPKGSAVQAAKIRDTAEAILARVNRCMSTYIEDSELSRFNRSDTASPFEFSAETFARFESALRVSGETQGAFDVTVGPIVESYGFGAAAVSEPPDALELQALRERVGYQKLILDADSYTVSKARGDLHCNLSAIAKGYGVDALAKGLDALALESYFIDIGGEVYAAGVKPDGEAWRVGIERPDAATREVQRVVALRDRAMATSGDYRNYYEANGRRVSHIIDPRTGRTIEHRLASVSVLYPTCELADAYATALLVLGPEEGFAFAEMRGLAALFLIRREGGGFEERMTTSFEPMINAPLSESDK